VLATCDNFEAQQSFADYSRMQPATAKKVPAYFDQKRNLNAHETLREET
jgi:hypothetical protein